MLLRQENSVLEAIPTDVKNEWKHQGGNADKSKTGGDEKWAAEAELWAGRMPQCAGSRKNCCKMRANKAEGEPS